MTHTTLYSGALSGPSPIRVGLVHSGHEHPDKAFLFPGRIQ